MTTTQLFLFATVAGAALFFGAGVAFMALWQQRATTEVVDNEPTKVRRPPTSDTERAQALEILRLRQELAEAETNVRTRIPMVETHAPLIDRAEKAETALREAKRRHDVELATLKADRDRLRAEADRLRGEADRLRTEADRIRAEGERLRADVERLQREATAAAATNEQLRQTVDQRAKQLDRSRTDSAAASTELEHVVTKLRDVERQLADKNASVRDLSTENEQLKGRLRDADALRTEYVRLRTATTDSEYLKSEIARLENELRAVRVDALGAQPRQRPARGTDRQPTAAERSIGESLASVIERFADAGTRSSALGDRQGFPLASSGSDGIALAAYAAHLFESASRAKEYLPVEAPSAIEIVDTNGVRVSVWSLEVEGDRLMLANLAVSPVDQERVETTLGALSQILAPSTLRASGARP